MKKGSIFLVAFVLLAAFTISVGAEKAHARTEDVAVPPKANYDAYGKARVGIDAGVKMDAPVAGKQNFLQSKVLPFFTGDKSELPLSPSTPKGYGRIVEDKMENTKTDSDDSQTPGEHFKMRFTIVAKSLLSIHARLETLATRIDERTKKLEAEGIKSAESQKYLAAARVDLKNAKVKIEALGSSSIKARIEAGTGADASGIASIKTSVESSVSEVRNLLKSAHANLISAISNLKPGLNVETKVKVLQ